MDYKQFSRLGHLIWTDLSESCTVYDILFLVYDLHQLKVLDSRYFLRIHPSDPTLSTSTDRHDQIFLKLK